MNTKSKVNVAQQHQGGGGTTFSPRVKRNGNRKKKKEGAMSAKQQRKQLYSRQAIEGKSKLKPAQREVVSEHEAEGERYAEQVDDRNYAAFMRQQGW